MNDEQKAKLEETRVVWIEEINRLIEAGETETFVERIRLYSEIIEMMARALVNKNKE